MARGLTLGVVFVAGCLTRHLGSSDEPGLDGGPSGARCRGELDCDAGQVCSRDGACSPPDQLRTIHATWTLKGAPASPASCAAAPSDLMITFSESAGDRGPSLSFVPVPCAEGKFTIDKLARSFDRVALGPKSGQNRQTAVVDAAGNAMLDLPY